MHATGWSKGLEVTADGEGIVSHAGPRANDQMWFCPVVVQLLRRLVNSCRLRGSAGSRRSLNRSRKSPSSAEHIVNLVSCLVAGMIGGLISAGRGWVRGRRCAVLQGVPVSGGDHQPLRVALPAPPLSFREVRELKDYRASSQPNQPPNRPMACSSLQYTNQTTADRGTMGHTGGTTLRTASVKHKRGTRWVIDNSGGQ